MNKPDILLYSVISSQNDFKDNQRLCDLCNIMNNESISVEFKYYDYINVNRILYHIKLCWKCYDIKIKGKRVKSLTNIIPLIKMRKGLEYNTVNASNNMPGGDLLRRESEVACEMSWIAEMAGVFHKIEIKALNDAVIEGFNKK